MQQNDKSLSYSPQRFITQNCKALAKMVNQTSKSLQSKQVCLMMLHESIALPNIEFQDNGQLTSHAIMFDFCPTDITTNIVIPF
jgi:hypothetical protein